MIIQHNLSSINSNRQYKINADKAAKSSEKLSSGYKINRSADDAAGLTISEKLRQQVRGLNKASINIQDGIGLIQVADGALSEMHSSLQRMRELYVQNCNDTNTTTDREAIWQECSELYENIVDIANNTTFNGRKILGGDMASYHTNTDFMLQVGATAYQGIKIDIPCCSPEPYYNTVYVYRDLFSDDVILDNGSTVGNVGLAAIYREPLNDLSHQAFLHPYGNEYGTKWSDPDTPNYSIHFQVFDQSIADVSQLRSELGAIQNRLEHAQANLDNTAENTTAAESRIRDTDMAEEMVELSKNNILMQAGESILAQANKSKENILSLLQ